MPRHDVARILESYGAFKHRLGQVAQRSHNAAHQRQHHPVVPRQDGVEKWTGQHSRGHSGSHTDGGALPRLAGGVARPHLVPAHQRAAHIGKRVVHPHHDDAHHQHIHFVMQIRHHGQRQCRIEHGQQGVQGVGKGLLRLTPQMYTQRDNHRKNNYPCRYFHYKTPRTKQLFQRPYGNHQCTIGIA